MTKSVKDKEGAGWDIHTSSYLLNKRDTIFNEVREAIKEWSKPNLLIKRRILVQEFGLKRV